MTTARAERLVNLVLCLLSTRQYLTAERIRAIVPGYADAPTDEAFFRMFERDKSELRDLGVPLETGRNDVFDASDGYRIARRDYELGDIDLEPDEAAAVALAARLWDSPQLTGAAHGALIKLRAAGVDVDQDAPAAVEPKVRTSEPAFPPLLAAVQAGQVGRVRLPPADARSRCGSARVEPWGVVAWRGRWYLVGHDRDRNAPRCFRLSRVVGDGARRRQARRRCGRPKGIDLMSFVARTEFDRATELHGEAVGGAATGRTGCVAAPRSSASGRSTASRRSGRDRSSVPRLGGQVDRRVRARCRGAGAGPAGQVRSGTAAGSATGCGGAVRPLLPTGCRDCSHSCRTCSTRPGDPDRGGRRRLRVTPKQLRKDLELLWMCGLPGYGPGDLIDLSFEGETITVSFDAGMNRPLRLTAAEATSLLVALRALAGHPWRRRRGRRARALAKIESAVGKAQPAAVVVGLAVREGEETAEIRDAVQDARAARPGAADPRTTRSRTTRSPTGSVDPMRLLLVEGRSYLEAWCRSADGRAAVPARPHRRRGAAGRAGGAAAARTAHRYLGGVVPAGADAARRRAGAGAGRALGGRVLPGRPADGARRRPRARRSCGTRTRRGWSGCCSAWAVKCTSSSRRSSPTRSVERAEAALRRADHLCPPEPYTVCSCRTCRPWCWSFSGWSRSSRSCSESSDPCADSPTHSTLVSDRVGDGVGLLRARSAALGVAFAERRPDQARKGEPRVPSVDRGRQEDHRG